MIGAATAVASKVNWKYVLIGVIILALLLYIYFAGKRAGKIGKPNIVGLPKDIGGTPIAGNQIREISTGLYDDMEETPWSGHNYTYYNEWVKLSDTGFVAVYNDFNEQYSSLGEGTLKAWIMSQTYTFDGGLISDIILPRMAKLNLV